MSKESNFRTIYPRLRYVMTAGRTLYNGVKGLRCKKENRPSHAAVIPDAYTVCNTSTYDSEYDLEVIEGTYPEDIRGNLYLCQCLGTPQAFMVGDTNVVKMTFGKEQVHLKNRLVWNPAGIEKMLLEGTRHRFNYMGLMYASPGLGIYSYMEGMYLLPDGRLAVTSDVDRPWILERDSLKIVSPVGRRSEWMPMLGGQTGEVMGNLFAGYSNSHVIYTDTETGELFLVNFQNNLEDQSHPAKLMRWDGYGELESWSIVDEEGRDIHIKQSIHELMFTRDYILLADTAFVAGMEMMTPWKNAPLPNPRTVVFLLDRRQLVKGKKTITARTIEIQEPCIHLLASYENPEDTVTVYMLHTPATNTAEILREYDRTLDGELFAAHTVGYGTLPVLDVSSIGKHVINGETGKLERSQYLREKDFTWGPYMYTYMGRQIRPFQKQDIYVMFKGFSSRLLPRRIYEAYKDIQDRKVPLEEMLQLEIPNSIGRIDPEQFQMEDRYTFPADVLLYTISTIETQGEGYLLAGVVRDAEKGSGHEYWLFRGKHLAEGPVCKLGHDQLNNSTLFHTVYIPREVEEQLDKKPVTYKIPMGEDYPREELALWGGCVEAGFHKVIYPYYDGAPEEMAAAEKQVAELARHRIREACGAEYLIEERSVEDPVRTAEEMVAEVERMLHTTGWKMELEKDGLLVESKPVKGPLGAAGISVTRAGRIVEYPCGDTFQFLTSPEGYAVIDPACDPEDHKTPPLEVYAWGGDKRLEAAVAGTDLPFLGKTKFVVLNAIDSERKIFVSKSILHEKMPGGSKYSGKEAPADGSERALNTFAIQIEPIDEKRCYVFSVNYADLCGKTSAGMNNLVNTKVFFKMFYKRLDQALEKKRKETVG